MKMEITKDKIAVVILHEEFFFLHYTSKYAILYQFGQEDSCLGAQVQNTEQ